MNARHTRFLHADAWIALTAPTIFALCYFVLFPDPPLNRVFYACSRIFLLAFPAACTLGARKHLSLPRFTSRGLGPGAASGLLIGGAIWILYTFLFSRLLPFDMVLRRAAQLGFTGGRYILFAVFLTAGNAAMEEYYWRWFTFSRLKSALGTGAAIAISSAGFALHHVVVLAVFFGWGWGPVLGAGVGAGGAIWAFLYDRYRSIWPCFASHALVDAALMIVGYDILFG